MTTLRNLLGIVCLLLSFAISAASNSPEQQLQDQLLLLIPGNNLEEQSARLYAQQRIQESIDRLNKRKIHKKKPRKAKVILREEVETHFLRTYRELTSISDLFKQGDFDQTSAVAVYTILMTYLNWPFEIRVEGMEVALYHNPSEGGDLVAIARCPKVTAATQNRFQSSYLDFLRYVGQLETNDWENQQAEAIFTANFLGETGSLSTSQFASFNAIRQVFKYYEARDWTIAQDWLQKSRVLATFPVQEVLERALWLQLANSETNGQQSLHYLWKLWEERPGSPWQGELIRRFNSNIITRENVSVWEIDSLYTDFQERFNDDEEAQVQLQEMYYLQRARLHAKEGRAVPVMNFMDSLYHLRPGDTDIQNVLAGMLVWTLQPVRNFNEGLERVDYYERRYPFLQQNVLFQDQHLFYQAERVRTFFDKDDVNNGWEYWRAFQALSQRMRNAPRISSWVSTGYLAVSNYFLRLKDYSSARSYVQEAVNLVPHDDYLQHRANLLKSYR